MLFANRGPKWILAFLGNPGREYENTRHNVGFQTAEILAERQGVRLKRMKHSAIVETCVIGGEKTLIMLPYTYMNRSGQSVHQAARNYRIPPERVIVVTDDVSLTPGKIRIRQSGSAGGHNGLKSIIAHLGTDQFPRIKIGVGSPPHLEYDLADWVLEKPRGKDKEAIDLACEYAAKAVECILSDGFDSAMNQFSG